MMLPVRTLISLLLPGECAEKCPVGKIDEGVRWMRMVNNGNTR